MTCTFRGFQNLVCAIASLCDVRHMLTAQPGSVETQTPELCQCEAHMLVTGEDYNALCVALDHVNVLTVECEMF